MRRNTLVEMELLLPKTVWLKVALIAGTELVPLRLKLMQMVVLETSLPGRRLGEVRGPGILGRPAWPTGKPTRRRASPSGYGARNA